MVRHEGDNRGGETDHLLCTKQYKRVSDGWCSLFTEVSAVWTNTNECYTGAGRRCVVFWNNKPQVNVMEMRLYLWLSLLSLANLIPWDLRGQQIHYRERPPWINTQGVSTAGWQCELGLSSGGRLTAEGFRGIPLVGKCRHKKKTTLTDKSVTHHSLCSQAPNSLTARSMETDESRRGGNRNRFGWFACIIRNTLIFYIRVEKNNNILQDASPTTLPPSALVFHSLKMTLCFNDPWCPCAARNYLGSNGSNILSIHI